MRAFDGQKIFVPSALWETHNWDQAVALRPRDLNAAFSLLNGWRWMRSSQSQEEQ